MKKTEQVIKKIRFNFNVALKQGESDWFMIGGEFYKFKEDGYPLVGIFHEKREPFATAYFTRDDLNAVCKFFKNIRE